MASTYYYPGGFGILSSGGGGGIEEFLGGNADELIGGIEGRAGGLGLFGIGGSLNGVIGARGIKLKVY